MKFLMRACLFSILLFSFLLPNPTFAIDIPDTITYCGIEIELTSGAKKILKEEVEKITVGKKYFDRMVLRAQNYFPYIEAAFYKHHVPMDLKYLAIQESGLRANATSTAKAVGFWQLKAPTAREVGLTVDEQIDERRHIYRASEGAAIYLSKANFDFTNWVYAVISYYEGPTGAVPYTNSDYFALKKMRVDENLHWYALKAIAHKLAYEPALKKLPVGRSSLEMIPSKGDNRIKKYLTQYELNKEKFLEYNPWLLKFTNLPGKKSYYLFIPNDMQTINQGKDKPQPVLAAKSEPKEEAEPLSRSVKETTHYAYPQAISRTILQPSQYASFTVEKDFHYGVEYIKYNPETPLGMLAMKLSTALPDLMFWNQLMPGRTPEEGQILYLKKPNKSEFHIVQKGENIGTIADMHKTNVNKIRGKNRLDKENLQIYIGQKLYLKKKKPKGELMIILVNDRIEETVEEEVTIKSKNTDPENKPQPPVKEIETTWIEHVVEEGETLWGISQKYDTKVEIIKMINKLAGDSIQPGQKLRILAKKEALNRE